MLLVNARVDRSAIHGLGLFAVAPIAKGTEVWRFTPGFHLDLDLKTLEDQPASLRERLLHYGYIDRRLNRYILCCDDARFINHSDEANIRADFTLDRYGVDIAGRDIAAGEEITVDYRLIEGDRP
jgi:SET domain-containing protein